MKTSLAILAVIGMLLPVTQLEAAPASKKFGGFVAGKKFTLTVTSRKSTKTKGDDVTKNASIPKDIPKFEEGEAVTFTIGKKGQLKGPGFSIEYQGSEDRENFYGNDGSNGEVARVQRTLTNRPKEATVIFYKLSFSGIKPVTNTVKYVLK